MPIIEQVKGLSVAEKRALLAYLLEHVTFEVVNEPSAASKPQRIGLMEGKWRLPDDETDRKMDEEMAAMFNGEIMPS